MPAFMQLMNARRAVCFLVQAVQIRRLGRPALGCQPGAAAAAGFTMPGSFSCKNHGLLGPGWPDCRPGAALASALHGPVRGGRQYALAWRCRCPAPKGRPRACARPHSLRPWPQFSHSTMVSREAQLGLQLQQMPLGGGGPAGLGACQSHDAAQLHQLGAAGGPGAAAAAARAALCRGPARWQPPRCQQRDGAVPDRPWARSQPAPLHRIGAVRLPPFLARSRPTVAVAAPRLRQPTEPAGGHALAAAAAAAPADNPRARPLPLPPAQVASKRVTNAKSERFQKGKKGKSGSFWTVRWSGAAAGAAEWWQRRAVAVGCAPAALPELASATAAGLGRCRACASS